MEQNIKIPDIKNFWWGKNIFFWKIWAIYEVPDFFGQQDPRRK